MQTTSQRGGETRQRIIEAAGQLFRQHGVDGVGVDAIMRQAGLTHGGFYAHFASKEALVAEVSHHLLKKSAAHWDRLSRLPERDTAFRRIVEPYLSRAHACSMRACPLTTLPTDVARRTAARDAIDQPLREMLSALERYAPPGVDPAAALATMVGAVVLARLAEDDALADRLLTASAAALVPGAGETGREPVKAPESPPK